MRVDLKQVDCRLAVTDSPVGDLPWMIRCREHDDSKASCAVYPDHLHCYGCNFHMGRRMDSLAYLLGFYKTDILDDYIKTVTDHTLDTNRAIQVAHKYTNAAVDGYRERVAQEARRDPLPFGLAYVYSNLLQSSRSGRIMWLRDRGLTEQTIRWYEIGHDGTRFTIPFFDRDNRLLTIRFRRDDFYGLESWDGKELAKYSGLSGRNASGAYLYPEWLVATQEEDHVVVVESELCVVRLRQVGIPAVCTFSGAGAMKHIPELLKPFEKIKRIVVAGDMDDRGVAGTNDLIDVAHPRYMVETLSWNPMWGKDPTELYLNGHTLQEVGYHG